MLLCTCLSVFVVVTKGIFNVRCARIFPWNDELNILLLQFIISRKLPRVSNMSFGCSKYVCLLVTESSFSIAVKRLAVMWEINTASAIDKHNRSRPNLICTIVFHLFNFYKYFVKKEEQKVSWNVKFLYKSARTLMVVRYVRLTSANAISHYFAFERSFFCLFTNFECLEQWSQPKSDDNIQSATFPHTTFTGIFIQWIMKMSFASAFVQWCGLVVVARR